MLRTDELDYVLPAELVATEPANPRDSARLMVVARGQVGVREDRHIRDLPELLRAGDLLVVNSTRVLAARFVGSRADTGGQAEGLYLGESADLLGAHTAALGSANRRWAVLLKMKRVRAGVVVALQEPGGGPSGYALRLIDRLADEAGGWAVEVIRDDGSPSADGTDILERLGMTPVPPYILAARRDRQVEVSDAADRAAYQTIYAGRGGGTGSNSGSVAAPTAGLHFTPELLAQLDAMGVERAEVVLHVGTGTFKAVETEYVDDHPMHKEWCTVPARTAAMIVRTRDRGGRVIAVGTTSARTLESFATVDDMRERGEPGVWTKLLITPGYRWKHVDGLLTNFHLPRSTLLALVAAMLERGGAKNAGHPNADLGSGVRMLKAIYAEAIRERYRFYSYGDAMLIM